MIIDISNENECFICYDKYPNFILKCCKKRIHKKCLKKWLYDGEKNKCPHCRQKINNENLDELDINDLIEENYYLNIYYNNSLDYFFENNLSITPTRFFNYKIEKKYEDKLIDNYNLSPRFENKKKLKKDKSNCFKFNIRLILYFILLILTIFYFFIYFRFY